MANTYNNLNYHIVFSTYKRESYIRQSIQDRLHAYLGGIIRDTDNFSFAINSMPDHIHVLTSIRAALSVAEFVKTIKSKSSKWVNEETDFPGKFAWQVGYSAFTVSTSQRPKVVAYIANQQEHHRVKPFQEELIEMLTKHGIKFDEKYLWN